MASNNMAEVQEQDGKQSEGGPCTVHGQTPEATTLVPSFVFLSCSITHLSLVLTSIQSISNLFISFGRVVSMHREAAQYGKAFRRQERNCKRIPYK